MALNAEHVVHTYSKAEEKSYCTPSRNKNTRKSGEDMRRIIAVVDKDKEYGKRLAAYLNEQSGLGMKANAFSSYAAYKKNKKQLYAEILLIDETQDRQDIDDGPKVIVLSEDGFLGGKSDEGIFKYMNMDEMVRKMLDMYAADGNRSLKRICQGQTRIIGIYSPIHRCGKSILAHSIARQLSSQERTVFLSFDESPNIYMAGDKPRKDLSDMIYSYLQENFTWSSIGTFVAKQGSLDYVPVARCSEDLTKLTSEQIVDMVKELGSEGDYRNIVIDVGSIGRNYVDIFEMFDVIFMPRLSDRSSVIKMESFHAYLKDCGREDVTKKISGVDLCDTASDIRSLEERAYSLVESIHVDKDVKQKVYG